MKRLLLLLIAISACAQPTLTTLADTVYNSVTGTPFSGTVVIQGPNIISPTNIPILGISRTFTISNGALSVKLVPNDTGTPTSTYQLTFSNGDVKTCTVPTSMTPVNMTQAGCVDGTQQAVPTVLALTQLASGGATAGQGLCFGSSHWVPGTCGAVPSGASLPATCAVGQTFFLTTASAGSNLYGCTATNTWTAQAGGGGGGTLPSNSNVLNVTTGLGDSLTYGVGASTVQNSYPSKLSADTGRTVINLAVSGEDSGEILGFLSGQPAQQLAGFWIIWACRNDFNGGSTWVGIAASNGRTCSQNIASMVSIITAGGGDYLIMSVLNACSSQEYTGGSGQTSYTNILAQNVSEGSTYGAKYLDIRGYLVAIDNDSGHDCPGPSLISAGVHLNDTGYGDVASRLTTWLNSYVSAVTLNAAGTQQAAYVLKPTISYTATVAAGTAYSVQSNPVFADYDGLVICFDVPAASTGASTMAFNGSIGNLPLVRQNGAAIAANDMITTIQACVVRHLSGPPAALVSNQWELLNPQTSSGGGGGQSTSGPGPLFGTTGSAGAITSVSYTTLTAYVYQFQNPYATMVANSFTSFMLGPDTAHYVTMALYDHNKNLVCQANTVATPNSPGSGTWFNIPYASPCNFTDPWGYLAWATNAPTGTTDFNGLFPNAGNSAYITCDTGSTCANPYVGTAAGTVTFGGSTITMPASLGTITFGFFPYIAIYRR